MRHLILEGGRLSLISAWWNLDVAFARETTKEMEMNRNNLHTTGNMVNGGVKYLCQLFFTWVTVANESSVGKYGGEGMIVYCSFSFMKFR